MAIYVIKSLLPILKKNFMLFMCTKRFSQLFIFSFILISLFICVISHQTLKYHKLELPYGVSKNVAFDCKGEGPYTGTSDGRILKWLDSNHGWKEFAITSPFRYEGFF